MSLKQQIQKIAQQVAVEVVGVGSTTSNNFVTTGTIIGMSTDAGGNPLVNVATSSQTLYGIPLSPSRPLGTGDVVMVVGAPGSQIAQ